MSGRTLPAKDPLRRTIMHEQLAAHTDRTMARQKSILDGLRELWRLADPADRPVVERIAKRVREGAP